jgi:flagellar hook-length control protein FliK
VTQTGDGVTEITLSPKELGRIQMTINTTETNVVLQISGERPETLDALRRQIVDLEQELKTLGYDSVAFEFSDHPPRHEQTHRERLKDESFVEELPVSPDLAPRAYPLGNTGLDIRV